MTLPILTIVHNLPDRVRLHFSVPPTSPETLCRQLMKDKRFQQASYSKVSQTIVIAFDHKEIELLHIFKMIAIALADQYNRQPIYVRPNDTYRFTLATRVSALLILSAMATRLLTPLSLAGKIAGWAAVGTTAAAVVEHAYIEIKRTGSFDPEALSIVYLINSAGMGHHVRGSLFTWLASFSRHLIRFPFLDGLKLSIIEGFDEVKKQKYLDVVTSGSISMASFEGKRVDLNQRG